VNSIETPAQRLPKSLKGFRPPLPFRTRPPPQCKYEYLDNCGGDHKDRAPFHAWCPSRRDLQPRLKPRVMAGGIVIGSHLGPGIVYCQSALSSVPDDRIDVRQCATSTSSSRAHGPEHRPRALGSTTGGKGGYMVCTSYVEEARCEMPTCVHHDPQITNIQGGFSIEQNPTG